jgi:hypothetical protein
VLCALADAISSPCIGRISRIPLVCCPCVIVLHQPPPDIDLARMHPKAAVFCEPGIGLAVCETLGVIFTSKARDSSISAFQWSAPHYKRLGTWGSRSFGPLPFDFNRNNYVSGGMCFTVAGSGVNTGVGGAGDGSSCPAPASTVVPLLLVASHGTDAVVVLDVKDVAGGGTPALVESVGGGTGATLRRVAASAALVAVSGWTTVFGGIHTVTLYTVHRWERMRVVGAGQLKRPLGLRFSSEGSRILVADLDSDRVCAYRVDDDGYVGEVASKVTHGLTTPRDVVEVSGGVLVCYDSYDRVARIPTDSSPVTVLRGVREPVPAPLDGFYNGPAMLHVFSDGAQFIFEKVCDSKCLGCNVEVSRWGVC